MNCRCCGVPTWMSICAHCRDALPRLGMACRYCACELPMAGVCGGCLQKVSLLDSVTATYRFSDSIRGLIHQYKYDGKSFDAKLLVNLMIDRLPDTPLTNLIFLPIPLHEKKLRERGYNQSALLAKQLSKRSGARYQEGWIVKAESTPSQQGLDRRARLKNLAEAFSLPSPDDIRHQHIMLIDDVMTTGATLETVAKLLKRAGAASVHGWVIAKAL